MCNNRNTDKMKKDIGYGYISRYNYIQTEINQIKDCGMPQDEANVFRVALLTYGIKAALRYYLSVLEKYDVITINRNKINIKKRQ